jgi:hypothetical protein
MMENYNSKFIIEEKQEKRNGNKILGNVPIRL